MIKIIEWVIKIGGSLFPKHAIELTKNLKNTKTLIITGGGEFANTIRKYDKSEKFSNDITHQTAIECMDIISKLLNDKFTFTQTINNLQEANQATQNNKIPILLCSEFLKDKDPFEHSWNVTSDSIAAYISQLLNAKLLIATNVNGIYTRQPTVEGAKFINEIDAKKLLTFKETSIDLMLPSILIKFGTNCYVVNGKYPERVLSIITNQGNKKFPYTYIKGE